MDTRPAAQSPMGVFGVKFYKTISEKRGNLVASPLSAFSALAMVLAGARGRTESEMLQALGLPSSKDDIDRLFAGLTSSLNNVQQVELSLANRAFAAADIKLIPDYVNSLKKNFASEIINVNFSDTQTRTTINEWVENVTNKKIKNLFADDFDSLTRLVLVNAVYFKGSWKLKFDEKLTQNQSFKTGVDSAVQVEMMNQPSGTYFYRDLKDLDAQLLELPYKGDELSMIIILPNKVDGLTELEKNLGKEDLAVLLSQASMKNDIVFSMPKFKIETTLDLIPYLKKIGLVSIFGAEADLRGISKEKLFVSGVIQKAFIEVNEEGTEASGATGVEIGVTSLPVSTIFQCDHPFLYFVSYKRSFTLFGGRVVNPANQ